LKGEDSVQMRTKWMFSDHQVNPELSDELFTIAYLKLPNGAPVQQWQLDGTEVTMIHMKGSVMSQKAVGTAKKLLAQQKSGAEGAASGSTTNREGGASVEPRNAPRTVNWIITAIIGALLVGAGAAVYFASRRIR
jgi:hypothetical protein